MTLTHLPNHAVVPDGIATSNDVTNAADITYRQLDFWCRAGYLRPLPRPPYAGAGYPRYFPSIERAVAILMARLADDGVQPGHAHELARELLDTGTARLAGLPIHLPDDL